MTPENAKQMDPDDAMSTTDRGARLAAWCASDEGKAAWDAADAAANAACEAYCVARDAYLAKTLLQLREVRRASRKP